MRTWAIVALALAGCAGSDAGEADRRAVFAARVVPVLEARCAQPSCHGVPEGVDHSVFGDRYLGLPIDAEGRITGEARVDAAYASALIFVDPYDPPNFSSLLRKNLTRSLGGGVHVGGAPFDREDDPDYRALADWIALEPEGGEGLDPAELTPLERRYADEVFPVLARRRCATSNCHGPDALLSTLRQRPGIAGVLPAAELRANYANAKRFLHLEGPATLSRLVLKGRPLSAGGLLHKGGNDGFLGDVDLPPILAWIEAERDAVFETPPTVTGVIFARGPAEPRPPFEPERPWWGSDLFLLSPPTPEGSVVNLTADLHDGPADVRDPAISYDGQRVAFAMRRGPDDAMNLYVMDVGGGTAVQLTFDAPRGGFVPFNGQPTFGPDGRLYFVSTRSGEMGERGLLRNTDLYALDLESGDIVRRTYGPNQEVRPAFFRHGGVAGELAFTSTRWAGERFNAPVFRFPPDLHLEYHVHFGTQRDGEMLLGIQDTPFGLHVVTMVSADAQGSAGRLAAIDRNFGPDIPDEARVPQAAVPRFAHTLTYLTAPEDGSFRDAFPLPDGRLLAARAEGDWDFGLEILALGPGGEDGRTVVRDRLSLVDAPGLADVQAVPVVARAPEPVSAHPHEDFESPTGYINMFNLPLLQALIETLEPRAKVLRDDLRFVRVLAAEKMGEDDLAPVDPGQVRNGDVASTRVSNGVHQPARALGTVPLGPDGSFYIEIPANTPVKFQALDAHQMAVGAQHERWIFANPGEVLFHSTHMAVYDQRCAGCHGTLDGRPEAAFAPLPDAVTGASVSYSTHEDADPFRPKAPVRVGLDGGAHRLDFVTDLQPILDRSCAVAGCHAGAAPAGDLSLTGAPTAIYSDAYESLLALGEGSGGGKRYVDEREARAARSFLIEKIVGRDLEAPRALDRPCPPPGAAVPPLSEADTLAFIEWIDAGATFRGAER